jgi:hypothetical protein
MAQAASGSGSGGNQPTAQQVNQMQRQLVLKNAVEMIQQVQQGTIATLGSGTNILNLQPRNVGLLKKFILELSGTATSETDPATATVFGLANLIQNVQFFDLNNNVRINTDGIQLTVLKQVKSREVSLSSMPLSTVQSDAMMAGQFTASGSAPNFPVIVYPLPATGGSSFRAVFEIPIAYSDDDLRGAVYMNVVNATATLQITLNPQPFSPTSETDTTDYVWYSGAEAPGSVTNLTYTLYQVYLDQLPVSQQGQVILPSLDLSTVYELKRTQQTGQVANLDNPYPYANFRDFLSTLTVWNSTGLTAGLTDGSDVNYWSLQSANFTNIWKIDPLLAAQRFREIVGHDLTLGTYYFSHRKKPLSTIQYGNLQLILNPTNALTSGSCYQFIYVEDFALVNALTQAGSLAA